jgi:LysM repeat protein
MYKMFGQNNIRIYILVLMLIVVLRCFPHDTFAQSETAYDLVNAVNDLRALHGLAPYTIDPWLMAYAQEHSEYQASIQSGTHQHRDGSLPQDIGLIENVAGGDQGVVTVAIVVYEIWVDWGHRNTLIGYATGEIGTGLALAENGQIYYTVDIRPGEKVSDQPIPGTVVSYDSLITSTPNEDGSIIHVVKYGDTLWSIAHAYGLSVDDIRRLNGMAGDATVIQIGQKLLIRLRDTITPTKLDDAIVVRTDTPLPPLKENQTSTITPSPTSDTTYLAAMDGTETHLAIPDSITTNSVNFPDTEIGSKQTLVIILILVGLILLSALILSFRGSGYNKSSGGR